MNKVILIGNLVRDPEARQIPSGRLVTNFTVAVNDNIPNANANFIRCVAWNNQANFLTTYLKKGDAIAIEGRIVSRSYVDNNGKTNYVTEVYADQVQSLSRRNQNANDHNNVNVDTMMGAYASINTDAAFSSNQPQTNFQSTTSNSNKNDDEEDEITSWINLDDDLE
ncbi:single-stranded DNA-binding protein [Ureaplasma urealyticum]|nr:single-stranded DNA-binding protein [Ureaplasma urealyticum]